MFSDFVLTNLQLPTTSSNFFYLLSTTLVVNLFHEMIMKGNLHPCVLQSNSHLARGGYVFDIKCLYENKVVKKTSNKLVSNSVSLAPSI